MLEVVEMVGGNGSIWVKRLVAVGAYEELHGYGGCGACHDKEKLEVFELGGGEPWWSGVGVGVKNMELDVVEEVPQTNEQEPKTWSYMSYKSAHDYI